MGLKGIFGILTGVTAVALATNSFEAEAAGLLGTDSTPGMLMFLGFGLVGLGMWGRKKIGQEGKRNAIKEGVTGEGKQGASAFHERNGGQYETLKEVSHEIRNAGPSGRQDARTEG